MASETVRHLPLKGVKIDADLNPRAQGLNESHVADLAEAIERGDELPPLVVYRSAGGTQWLSEGFHRAEAYRRKGVDRVPCVVRKGERADALANACGSNSGHGLKRTNADKRRAVELLLKEFPNWSNPRVAEAAAVSVEFVRKMRPAEEGETRETSDGRAYPTSPRRAPAHEQSNEGASATVADAPRENALENAVSPPEGGEPEPVDPADAEPEQPAEDDSATQEQQQALEELRDALDTHGGPPPRESGDVDEGGQFVATVEALCRDADHIVARMKALKASPYSHSIHVDSAVAQVEAARKTLWQGRPAHPCPYCKAEPRPACRACRGTGRVKRSTFDSGRAAVGDAA